MQVFVPYPSPIDVAKCLDTARLRKQILEADQILNAISGQSNAWKNHPITKMYSKHGLWLANYRQCLFLFLHGNTKTAEYFSEDADDIRPPFLTSAFCDQHKRRLYTKAPRLYPQFAEYGKSEENWYYVNGKIVRYVNGNRV